MWRWLTSLRMRLTILLVVAGVAGALIYAGVSRWPVPQVLHWLQDRKSFSVHALSGVYGGMLISLLVLLPLALWLAGVVMAPVSRLLRALEGAVASYRDGDFSFSIAASRRDELGQLIRMHNALGQTLREQRQYLVQRELLLDTVVQNTPVALVLTDAIGRVAYANIASRHLFNNGRSLQGMDFSQLLAAGPDGPFRLTASWERPDDDRDCDNLSAETISKSETFSLAVGQHHQISADGGLEIGVTRRR